MRSVVVAAALLAGIILTLPARAAAQDPETPPPPQVQRPPQQETPRGEARSPRVRDENREPVNRAPERSGDRAVDRPVRAPDAPVANAPAPSRPERADASRRESAAASSDDDQGARPRGSVRRPPPGGGSIGGRPVDRAVPRSEARAPSTRTTIIRNYPRYYPNYSLYYDPWGFGSFGLGYFYYSPWTWGPYGHYGYGYGGGGYYPRYPGAYGFDIGSVRIKVKPRDAEVWVDGYYAGSVDDFDGIFQALKLDLGAYRIEVRKPGYETLTFDVRVQPDRTITFRGEMRPLP